MFNLFNKGKKNKKATGTETFSVINNKCSNCRYYNKKTRREGECCHSLKRVLNQGIDRYIDIGRTVRSYFFCESYENKGE